MRDIAQDPATIEDRIAAERGALSQTLDSLLNAVAPEKIAGTIADSAQREGAALLSTAKRNPGAVALLGIGAAWMIAGAAQQKPQPVAYDTCEAPTAPGFAGDGTPQYDGQTARIAAADAASTRPSPTASQMRRALDRGLEHLPEGARARVRQAREAAITAQDKVEAKAAQAARDMERLAHRNPLATAGIAAGIGALVGAVLPGSEAEDKMLGAKSDALIRDAEALLQSELRQARATAEAAVRDGVRSGEAQLRSRLHS